MKQLEHKEKLQQEREKLEAMVDEALSRNESIFGNDEIYEQARVVERLMDEENECNTVR